MPVLLFVTALLIITGCLVNGPYSLITTAVSADLGQSLQGDAKALATVSAIIDGTGSIGKLCFKKIFVFRLVHRLTLNNSTLF